MKDILLLCATLAMFGFGYLLMKRLDRYLDRQHTLAPEETGCRLQVAVESPLLVNSLSQVMDAYPWISFCVRNGSVSTMLQRLREGSVDLLLLADVQAQIPDGEFSSVRIPYFAGSVTDDETGLCVSGFDETETVCVLWNRAIASPGRDRVVCALQNDFSVGSR